MRSQTLLVSIILLKACLGAGASQVTDCWWTGCQLNTWATTGCAQYDRVEDDKVSCTGGNKYRCCVGGGPEGEAPPEETQGTDCWWTGCQLNTWAITGCHQYNRVESDRRSCTGGNEHYCCVGGGGDAGGGVGSGGSPGENVIKAISLEQFNQACLTRGGVGGVELYNSFINSFARAKITEDYEAAKYLAHTVWESMGLTAVREIYCLNEANHLQCANAYGTGQNGVVYFGRGPIQLSHNYNYRAASQDIFGDANVLLNDPDRVARDSQTGWDTAAYFWSANVHANSQTFGSTLKKINGALECEGGSHGENMWKRCDHYRKILEISKLDLPDRESDCRCSSW